jgi:hypothetical protein
MPTQNEILEKRKRLLEERMGYISDDDISIVSAWEHQQNVEGSEKLLAALEKHHASSGH